jgi:hypothetical protein
VRAGIADGAFRADADDRQFATDVYGVMLAFYHAYRLLQEPGAERRARAAFDTLLTDLMVPSTGAAVATVGSGHLGTRATHQTTGTDP